MISTLFIILPEIYILTVDAAPLPHVGLRVSPHGFISPPSAEPSCSYSGSQ